MNTDSRAPIPAEVKRRVLVEAGHRCAIPTCRYISTEIHHIIPWETCRTHDYHNLIALCPNCHNRADRGEIDRKSLRLYKASLRYTHDKFSQFEVDVLISATQLPPQQGLPFPRGMELLVKRLTESGYVELLSNQNAFGGMGGVRMDPYALIATPAGTEYVRSLGLETSEWTADDA